VRELEALMRAQEAEESARLESEAADTSREAIYLRADLCATFLSEGALLEKVTHTHTHTHFTLHILNFFAFPRALC
jgi:hypothetical protein